MVIVINSVMGKFDWVDLLMGSHLCQKYIYKTLLLGITVNSPTVQLADANSPTYKIE